ncbi:MAG: response regulator [Magnetococcales bacterium]|nr:response regulator [Magnetococcales bacterium]
MNLKTVLVVDDSKLAQLLTKKTIQHSFPGWKVLSALSAEEGLLAIEKHQIDVVLLDFNMPGMSGLEMAQQVMKKAPNLTVHLVTANTQDKMRERAEALGIGFISKPVSEAKLLTALSAV